MKFVRALTLLTLGLATACQEPRAVDFSIQLPSGPARDAEQVVVSIHTTSGCGGQAIYTGLINLSGGSGAAMSMPRVLTPGTYYISVEARDAECSVLASACQEVILPIDDGGLNIVATNASGEACPPGQCTNGVCDDDVPPDAGPPPDTGPPMGCNGDGECPSGTCQERVCCNGCWDGASCQAGTGVAACGREGGACSACGSDQTCTAGVCENEGPTTPDLSLSIDTTYIQLGGQLYSAGDDGTDRQRGSLVSSTPNIFSRQDTEIAFSRVAAMETTACGIAVDGALYCWGSNIAGLLGIDSAVADPNPEPQRVGADRWIDIEAGNQHFCAIRDDNHLLCWGNNADGRLGTAGSIQRAPTDVDATTEWIAVSGGDAHTCGVRTTGALYCWGAADDGRLGIPAATGGSELQRVGSGMDWTAVSAGAEHTCGVRGGDLYCWGLQTFFRLGTGMDTGVVDAPVLVDSTRTWVSVSAGQFHSCGLTDTGEVLCWGVSTQGQTGVSGDATVPTRVAAGFAAVEVSWTHSCALATPGLDPPVFCWGSGTLGQTGLGSTEQASAPAPPIFEPAL